MKNIILFILFPVLLTTIGEFVLKFNINKGLETSVSSVTHVEKDLKNKIAVVSDNLLSVKIQWPMVSAIAMIILGGLLWLVAMSKYELSFLYPFLSINYTAIVIGSQFFLGEEVSFYRYLSIVFIIIGLILVSKSPHSIQEKGD